MKVVAYICAYNEADILPWALAHLRQQGVEPYVIDNWSTDGTEAHANERFPAEPSRTYDWAMLLSRVEELAAASDADWCLHHDADELRYSPWPGVTLAEGFGRVEQAGYNAVDFSVVNFRPVNNDWDGSQDPRDFFRYHEPHSHYDRQHHIKAWRNVGRVDLASSGGHRAEFLDRRVFPKKFILRHYPIRSQEHGERKVFRERQPRFRHDEVYERGWHCQYQGVAPGHSFLADAAQLVEWEEAVPCSP